MNSCLTRVHLVRHGEVFNPDRILYGRLPGYRLSETGHQQAQAVAHFLAQADIVAVIASPLQRAQQTAQPIAQIHHLDITTNKNLIEAENIFEGKHVSPGDGAWRNPRYWWYLRNPFTPSWGEPYRLIAQRMSAAIDQARVNAIGHEVVCVSHQLPVWIARQYLTGQKLWHDPRHRQCDLGSITTLTYEDHRLISVDYHCPSL